MSKSDPSMTVRIAPVVGELCRETLDTMGSRYEKAAVDETTERALDAAITSPFPVPEAALHARLEEEK